MNQDRAARVWSSIVECARREAAALSLRHACLACAEAVSADAAVLLLTSSLQTGHLVFATNPLGEELVELQTTSGQGPALDAAGGFGPVLVPDLASAESRARWPGYAPEAVRAGARAQFSIPLRIGAVRVGALDLHRREARDLTPDALADTIVYADAALAIVLDSRAGTNGGESGETFFGHGAELHQAAGMVSVQLGVPVGEAMVRLRAHAYARGERLGAVAKAVVQRRLRFAPSDKSEGEHR
ncbi:MULTISPECIES: GAF and ANTAR domain-containing protein [Amycolatopsis]|uniref:ANTAR domain-containing protein n=2 Tax=Amycolatopsis TaxID=1813 RepID=A0A1I4CRV5_9PSEU|nr:GAF and ANTAR domain-containing protein [Amycolatopsis sacchari]SFK83645.1 ANTAR domain-containing protein [Amycolatopsis sacchari]